MNQRERDDLYWELFGNTSALWATIVRLRRHAIALGLVSVIALTLYAANVYAGWRAQPTVHGTMALPSLRASVVVRRDHRGVPHVTASNEHDLFFAQGFVEGSDRLFQMELTRRYALGELAEIFGARVLALDESQRLYDVRDVADRQWKQLGSRERNDLEAFSAGVNAAMRAQPLPVEFRLLLYRPKPWTPQDCLAVSLAVSIALADSWRDVLTRNEIWKRVGPRQFEDYVPLSDPIYDVTLRGDPAPHNASPFIAFRGTVLARSVATTHRAGSDAWATGAARTQTRRALLANDPHLDLTIPGLWYLLDLKAPGFHAAGAAIPGVPGILLGHNERIAWGATNSDASAVTLFYPGQLARAGWKRETFRVRFGRDVSIGYYRTARDFGVPCSCGPQGLVLVRWAALNREPPAIATFLKLDRARNVHDALTVLSRYGGTSENFVIADTQGNATYHLAGGIVNDAAWGRYVHASRDLPLAYGAIPFALLPAVAASRDAVIVSANNKMYGNGYPYRLAAAFDAPYRAYRISQMLHERRRYDVAYFAQMQLDTRSPIDSEFAHAIATYARDYFGPAPNTVRRDLATWDGAFTGSSRAATIEHAVRVSLEETAPSLYAVMQQLRHGVPSAETDENLRGALYRGAPAQPWALAGAVPVEHPLAPLRIGFLNGATLPGDGDEYTIHLQEEGFAQSFRAVWDVGNWDAGGISIPSGESGEPRSGHYTDLTSSWIAGTLEPLPFSERAVEHATRERLRLVPEYLSPRSAAHTH